MDLNVGGISSVLISRNTCIKIKLVNETLFGKISCSSGASDIYRIILTDKMSDTHVKFIHFIILVNDPFTPTVLKVKVPLIVAYQVK